MGNQRSRRVPVWQREACEACSRPVIIAEEDTGGMRLRGALLSPEPDLGGPLVRREDGYLIRDYAHEQPGERWGWHRCPVRNPERVARLAALDAARAEGRVSGDG